MRVLAAGSLRSVWQPLMAQFPEHVDTQFGPAGLLRERIEAGERCDLFASANLEHPLALQRAGRAASVTPFASNRLCLTVRSDVLSAQDDWRSVLMRGDLRVATSTAGADPSGDYTQVLFSRMGEAGEALRTRAIALVGGRDSSPIPAEMLAAQWIIFSGQAEVFIGYASYAAALRQIAGLTVMDIPAPYNPRADYACAVITPRAQRLADFLQSDEAKGRLRQAGFGEPACPKPSSRPVA
ncbi:TPA: molybdate ABC transporter substrate-binding protein [Enterobacter cancerogenus]|uniref:molybdate ABC transporter substrate-binding protein n=1 Tax=Enterobacter cancerogenus TaxID=69218 RepID=UPI000182718E|nr:molybdate ABC transporter substrate-binding protein [Enterobacter cancerogenus]EFC54001.1 molybdate ABC transporter, periplasmic molybdate-binding protein [Enterobacter cancerogenus ATCC 35316]